MEKIYFGHPINFYNTEKEYELIEIIKKRFPQFILENPNQLNHQERYNKYKERTGNGMDYFFREVLPLIDRGIFLSFEDRMFSIGVFREAKFLDKLGKLIYEINLEGQINPMSN